MALRIANNVGSLKVQGYLQKSTNAFDKSLERLSSGYRINHAADDAAGLAISEGFRADIASFKVATRNANESASLIQVAEGAMTEIGNMLVRLKELATQAASANAGSNLDKLDAEADELMSEINRIAASTEYADTALINGGYGNTATVSDADINANSVRLGTVDTTNVTYTFVDASGNTLTLGNGTVTQTVTLSGTGAQSVNFDRLGIKFDLLSTYTTDTGLNASTIQINQGSGGVFQLGAEYDSNNTFSFNIGDMRTSALNSGATLTVDLSTQSGAQSALNAIDNAISYVALRRGNLGAYQNRLGYTMANLSTTVENFVASESVIRDVDMASEMSDFTKNQILLQSGTAMLAQANVAPQLALQLLK